MSEKRIIVYSLDEARAACAAAAVSKTPVTLMSGRGMASFMGPPWFKSVVDQAAASAPEAGVVACLDCADEPGTVLAALRTGFPLVRFTGPEKMRRTLDEIAQQMGARVEGKTTAATLDLLRCRDAAAACREFLAVD